MDIYSHLVTPSLVLTMDIFLFALRTRFKDMATPRRVIVGTDDNPNLPGCIFVW